MQSRHHPSTFVTTRTITRGAGGIAAGIAGTIAMGGMSFLIRRLVEPTSPISKTHYESVVEWTASALSPDETGSSDQTAQALDDAFRIRAGELTHLGFGAFWGLVFALLGKGRDVRPIAHGTTYGIILWVTAFEGYMPALGIAKSLREMGNYERARTLLCHLTYAITTVTFLRAFRPRPSA